MKSALIVGGGPAGLSAGIALATAGYAVEVHELRAAWKGRVCGSFINPDGVRALAWMGLLDEAQQRGAVPVVESAVVTPTGRYSTIPTMQGETPSLAFQRRKLEELLKEELERRGGRMIEGSRAIESHRAGAGWETSTRQGEFVSTVHTDLLVRAAGRFSETTVSRDGGWFGWNALFCNVPQSPGEMSLHFGKQGYVGVLTFADGTTNVCGLTLRRGTQPDNWESIFLRLKEEQPTLERMMSGARRLDDWHGVGPLPFTSRPRAGSGAILAGDAGAVGDPFMGEGIGRALATGPLLADAIEQTGNAPGAAIAAAYASRWRRAYSSRLAIGWAARWLLERPWLTPVIGGLIRPAVLKHAMPLFHRGGGFHPAPKTSARS